MHILHVEDNPLDCALVRNLLHKKELVAEIECVSSTAAFQEALQHQKFALILADYTVPGMDPCEVLRLAKQERPEVPFVFFSGTIGDDLGIQMLKRGASDYILKQHPERLVPAIHRVLREAEERSQREKAEQSLRQSEQRFRSFVEATAQVVWRTNPRGEVDLAIPAWQAFTGQSTEEASGFGWMNAIRAEDRPHVVRAWQKAFETQGLYEVEYLLRIHDGSWRNILARGVPVRDADGTIREYMGVCIDITAQKQAEFSLRESEEKFRAVFERAAIGMGRVKFTDACWIDVNNAFCEMLGYSTEEFRTTPWPQITHPDDVDIDMIPFRRMAAGELDVYTLEKRFIHKQGHPVWTRLTLSVVRDAHGHPEYEIAIIENIDDRKKTQETLHQHLERMEELSQAAAQLLEATDPHQIVPDLFKKVAQRFDLDTYLHFMLSNQEQDLHLDSFAGIPQKTMNLLQNQPLEKAPWGRVAASRKPLYIPDFQHSQVAGIQPLKEAGLRAYTCIPLVVGNRLLGTLALGTRQRDRYSEEELQFFHTLCQYLALAKDRLRFQRALQEADRRKDEFLATLAHELRNPLAPIRNAIQMLEFLGPQETAQKNARRIIDRQVTLLARLVDDLLDVSRITRGKLTLHQEELDLAKVVHNALETSQPLIQAGRHDLQVTLPAQPLLVKGDLVRLAQALSNLLNNAAKYTPDGGKILLRVDRKWDQAVIRIRDSGIGISREMLPRVFEMFAQIEKSLVRAQGGLGIGLALVRSLVEMHGGSVQAYSEGPNRGSEFIVRLPLLNKTLPAETGFSGPNGEKKESVSTPAQRILVVDDNMDATESMAQLLQILGHDVQTAHDGPRALELAAVFRPDIVLLDIGMPEMNGYEVARAMRRMPEVRDAFLVAQTGWGQEDDRRRAMEAGFNAHLVKPVDFADLQNLFTSDGRGKLSEKH